MVYGNGVGIGHVCKYYGAVLFIVLIGINKDASLLCTPVTNMLTLVWKKAIHIKKRVLSSLCAGCRFPPNQRGNAGAQLIDKGMNVAKMLKAAKAVYPLAADRCYE